MALNIAKVAVAAATYAIDRPYDYAVPPEVEGTLRPGMRVLVPFGAGNRRTDGIVLAVAAGESRPELKSVAALLDDEPVMEEETLKLILWMREQYFCTVYEAARAVLPAGLWFSMKDSWKLCDGVDRERAYEAAGNNRHARHLVELLFANDRCAELTQIRAAFGTADPNPAIRLLREQGIVKNVTSTQRGVGDKTEQVAVLELPPEEAMALIAPKRRTAPLQYAVVEQLCAIGRVSTRELCYFTGASMTTVRTLARRGILRLEKQEVFRRPELPVVDEAPEVHLNGEQTAAFEGLSALLDEEKGAAALLYGVTGSGKTQVYIKLIFEVLARRKTALVLVPEIALTPQLMSIFTAHFGRQVAILHSALSAGERYDEWKRARAGQARVVVGTRSAVFAPLPDLGLVVLDEEQEGSYKSEQTPRYHARDIARWRCAKGGALLVLGSATPSVESMYFARTGKYRLFQMAHRYSEKGLPTVDIVDLKEELRAGNGGTVSRPLQNMLGETFSRGEQAILFLNRRGASRMATCGECGQVPTCPRCSVHLTYHAANRRLMCHYCGHSEPVYDTCRECGGLLAFTGAGTQKAEEELRALFPWEKVLRMDADTVTATRSHEKILEQFRKKKASILLGTQMVAKGLDFENVTLVGVLAADQGLYIDDFRAAERTFSLITQVVGRAGRGGKAGRAVIQTYTPDNDVIRRAAAQDYDGFYADEIRMRAARDYPPFRDQFVLTLSGLEEGRVIKACLHLREELASALKAPQYADLGFRLLGPAPAAIAKVNERYRYRLTLSAENKKNLRDLLAHLVRQAQKDKRNKGVSITVDVNPMN